MLLTAGGVGANEIMRRTAKSKTCVWRWQERFVEEGLDGLLRDTTRPSRRQSGLGAIKRWEGCTTVLPGATEKLRPDSCAPHRPERQESLS